MTASIDSMHITANRAAAERAGVPFGGRMEFAPASGIPTDGWLALLRA